MMELHKRRPGSMFKRFFILITVSVLFCLTVSSFSLLLFFMNFWKSNSLASLSDDALSLAQSVEVLFNDSAFEIETPRTEKESKRLASSIFSSVSQTADADMFIVNNSGAIVFCKDRVEFIGDEITIKEHCAVHDYIIFPQSLLREINSTSEKVYTYEGKLAGVGSEEFLFAAVPVSGADDTIKCYAVLLQSAGATYLPYTNEFVRMLIIASLIAAAISFVSSLIVSYRMVRPLRKVREATKLYSSGDFSMRISDKNTYSEFADMVSSINSMAENLALMEESRSNFVANVSHELKTPMTIISGFVDGILDGTIPECEHEKYLKIVSDEVKRLSRLVVAMLNMAKIEAGKLTLNLTETNFRNIILNTFLGFEQEIEKHEIHISGLNSLEDISVHADEVLLNQVIYNLVDNAVKFTPFGGTISVNLGSDKKNAVFIIRNTGKGIAAEDTALIFDRFYKVDKSRGLDAKSFGMGLYIIRSIIELHSGTISINSEPDEYTEFVIKLPL